MMVSAFATQRLSYTSCRGGSSPPHNALCCFHHSLKTFLLLSGAAPEPRSGAAGQDALNGAVVKSSEYPGAHFELP